MMPKNNKRRTSRRNRRRNVTNISRVNYGTLIVPNSINGKELKTYQGSMQSLFSSISTTALSTDILHNIANGTNAADRIGTSIVVHSLEVQFTIAGGQSNLSTDDAYNTVSFRCIINRDGSPLGPNVSRVLNCAEFGCIRILCADTFCLVSKCPNTVGYMPAVKCKSYHIPINQRFVWRNDGNAYSTEQLVLQMVSDSSVVTNPGIVTGYYMITFTDE